MTLDRMPKDSWVMIDRTQFNLEDIKIERIDNIDNYLYVQLNRNELKNKLDKYHYEYLLDCYGGKPLISFEKDIYNKYSK